MDYLELRRTLDDLNEWKRTSRRLIEEEERIAGELEKLNEYLKPYGLWVALIESPYKERYLIEYAILSLTSKEQ